MSKGLGWSFPKIVLGKDEKADFATLEIDEVELNIIWFLGKEGPKSIYSLMKTIYIPKHVLGYSSCDNFQIWERKVASKKETTYHYPTIRNAVRKLKGKGLVNTLKDSSGDRTKRIVNLTFEGLILYLRSTDDKQKFAHAIEHYRSLIPFADIWESLVKQLGEETAEALESTLKSFQVRNVMFRIKPLRMKSKGYLESVKVLLQPKEKFVLERNQSVADCLRSNEARILRESYIAYLTLKDIERLSSTDRRKLEAALTDLKSERELAYFENRDLSSQNSLFKGGRIKEFLPRCSGIESFFTGIFVYNLVWNKKRVERHRECTDEFDIEYL
jgi:DNA-binding PadR family transcriptional regulator